MFTAARIGLFERLAYNIASAVARQQAVEAMRASEAKLRREQWNLAEAQRITHIGSWDWNIVDNHLFWSDEVFRIFGLECREFGASYDAFLASVHPDDREAVKAAVNQSLASPEVGYSIQHRVLRPDGSMRLVHERGEVKFDDLGKAVHMIGTVHDITEQKAMEEETRRLRSELAHSERVGTIGALTSAIAHEINQPLAAILSNAQAALRLLKTGLPHLEEVQEALADIVSDDKRAAEIINRMRRMLKKNELSREKFDLSTVMAEVLPLIRSEFSVRKTRLEQDLEAGLPPVAGDPVQIQQVALNLLMNALDALSDQPESERLVVITTRPDGDGWVSVLVSDTGPGIPAGTLENIFTPFYSTKPQGIGLGLAICRFIAEAHGGVLQAKNRPEGGSEISLRLPKA
jgi:PAS domain S-box-containing protein